ncbi:peptidoglycan D,D-transpeptidase FtsI family protein [Intestinibacter bartlettii]|uniref:Penicillin-binding protein 2 n=1 Tax=Intestinibacter bartlettii TaxID=261299 RepID=A0ABS6DUK8_9FIRM|nr:penicillin-binding protein 2 [Intestinibacter bartlettii]MBU5335133.1 penicillin-binding protein 2 [Intestinibacter bartlettii]
MSRKLDNIDKILMKRIKKGFCIFVGIVLILIIRLSYLGIYKYESYKNKIESQSTQKVNLNSGRGIIYDRNNKRLTDIQKKQIIIIPKTTITGNYKNIDIIKQATGLDENNVFEAVQNQIDSELIEIEVGDLKQEDIKKLEKINIIVDEKTDRYKSENLLSHTIGYINKTDGEGVSGIEKSMDSELKNSNQKYISVFKAGYLGAKNGLNLVEGSISKTSNNEKNLKLTIDSTIQKKVENIVDKEENPTAVVISDVQTGEILAMSSRPNFNQNKIEESLNKTDGQLQNRVISATYPPGSVFKIAVLFAALENKVITNSTYYYNCTGSEQINEKEKLNCNNLSGHGIQTLAEVFANSCNPAFYDIAKKVGKDEIYKAIKTLHLDQKVDIGLDEEVNSNIPDEISLSNLSIGQGSLCVTPLQINQMTQIIANNGLYKPLYIYDSIVDNSMNEIKKLSTSKEEELISPYTSTQIKQFMIGVSKIGTAKTLSDLEGGCGVKTGTAQSSVKNTKVSHGWITGFYPKENPKYAITVLVEGTQKSSKSAIPIFKDICNSIK